MTRNPPQKSSRTTVLKIAGWAAGAVALLGVAAGALFLHGKQPADAGDSQTLAVRPVRVVEVEPMGPVQNREFPGVTKERQESKLAFRVSGPLLAFDVNVGQRLAEGDVIAQIDPRDFELAVARAEAGMAEAKAGLKAMRDGARSEDIAALEAKLGGAKSKLNEARIFRDRFQALVQDGSVARAKLDNASASFDVAQAEVHAAEKQLEKAMKGAREEEIEGMEAKIAGLKVQLAAARNALNDTTLRAPFAGDVSQKYVENHETVAAGHPIVSLLDCSSIDVTAGIPEDVVIQQDRFRSFACQLDAYPDRWFEATLKEIGPSIQHGKLTYPLTVTLRLPADLFVRPGMTARVRIEIAQGASNSGGFRLPPVATVLGDDGEPSVWVVDSAKDTVYRQVVTTGKLANDGIEITGGLHSGQLVVTAGAPLLYEGQRVRIERPRGELGGQAAPKGKTP